MIAGLALGLLGVPAAGCGDDGGVAAPERTTTTAEPAVTTTTEPEDPWAVPEEIDEAYVQRVLQELYRLDGDARRIAVREGIVTEEVIEIVRSIYVPEEATWRLNELLEGAAGGFEGVLRPPGDVAVRVLELSSGERDGAICAIAYVSLDFSEVLDGGLGDVRLYSSLERRVGNTTGWLLGLEAIGADGTQPSEMDC